MDEKTVARIYEIRAAKKALEAEEKELVASLGELDLRDYAVGSFRVRVQPNRRFDPALAAEVVEGLADYQKRKVTKRVVDNALLKIHFPELFAQSQKDYAPKVVVDIPND